jgi:hypothetical protein
MIKFEWNQAKDRANQQKQGISFERAKSVFYDDYAIQFFDEMNSIDEDRFLLLGRSLRSNVLIVCHCVRAHESKEIIRIISARRATRKERKHYEGGNYEI